MDGRVWALVLAVIGLALGVVARRRAQRSGTSTASQNAVLLVPCAIIIGTVPWVLHLSETVRNSASIASIVVSISAMVLMIREILRQPRA
jgi:uncharacterized membrane protein YoaK (UPF0700 family)